MRANEENKAVKSNRIMRRELESSEDRGSGEREKGIDPDTRVPTASFSADLTLPMNSV